MSSPIPFRLSTLQHLDGGRVDEAFATLVDKAIRDCIDRPNVSTARTVTITMAFAPCTEPTLDGKVDYDGVDTKVALSSKLPKMESMVYSLDIREPQAPDGLYTATFNADMPDNTGSLFDDDDITEEE